MTDLKTALVFSDCHFPYQNNDAICILLKVLSEYVDMVDEIIDLGDSIDGTKLSTYPCYEDFYLEIDEEIDRYNEFIDSIRFLFDKKITITKLEDNHFEKRMKRKSADESMLKEMCKIYHNKMNVDKIIKYNEPYFPFNQRKIAFLHGDETSKYYAEKYTTKFTHTIVAGHTHKKQHFKNKNNIEAYGCPCMCRLDMKYTDNKKLGWSNGFMFVSYNNEEDIYGIEYVDIIENKAIYRNKIYKI